jgi:aromatic-L-amino-acid decarboxylase
LQEAIREHVRLAQTFAAWVEEEPGWEVAAPQRFSLVCFRREASDEENARILDAVNASGIAFLSGTRLHGRTVLRLAIGSHRTTEEDVRRTWDALRAAS